MVEGNGNGCQLVSEGFQYTYRTISFLNVSVVICAIISIKG